ncbi:MAG TPA: MEDS domain-containing protein [Nitrososphaeraceae archaeon]|nr:MEDS domain-containing protein [Nitrososphaeraceae archaeon]
MKPAERENNYYHHTKEMVHGNSLQVAEMMAKKNLLAPGSHNLLIYDELKTLREIYSQYARTFLPENEIIVIGTQYEAIDAVKTAIQLRGVEVERYLNQGTLFIVDAQKGYQDTDTLGMWKLAMSLIFRIKKEGRRGVTWFGDLGSFFSFEKIEELIQYELWCPQKYEDKMKTVCCYHLKDFEKLNETQKQTLFDHHFKSISIR